MTRRTYNPRLAEYVGQRIKAARVAAGYSQRWLADEVGVGDCNVSRWETGVHSPSLESLALVALALGIEPAELLPPGSALRRLLYAG